MTRLRTKCFGTGANDEPSPNAQMTKVQRHYRVTPSPFLAVKILRSTRRRGFAMKALGLLEFNKHSTEGVYGLEKILHRVRRSVRFYLPLWLSLVREADAWRASGSANTLANSGRLWQSLLGAYFWTHCHGVLPDATLCTICPGRWRRPVRNVGRPGRADICRC